MVFISEHDWNVRKNVTKGEEEAAVEARKLRPRGRKKDKGEKEEVGGGPNLNEKEKLSH